MRRWLLRFLLGFSCLVGCQTAQPAAPSPPPTPTTPIDTIYFSETPFDAAHSIAGIAIVSSPEALDALLSQTTIKILYLDQTSIDRVSNQTLSLLYRKSVMLASFDTPLSMLAKKSGHQQTMPDLELSEPRVYISALVQMKNVTSGTKYEYHDFFYGDFTETHRLIQLQWRMSRCNAKLDPPSQCAEFR
ncbi:hypothetical protein [Herpetosiphon llansteffanensis]|uniref:hypothetical protein n=1 Tax=Herpetosiphon llansteffanensis TaxID=2094568 RepID=UPI000D7CEB5B|nr:hypothetical protein [Herpetosiphon llansteffanensis]